MLWTGALSKRCPYVVRDFRFEGSGPYDGTGVVKQVMDKDQAKNLDKFYTRDDVALKGLLRVKHACKRLGVDMENAVLVEPSAGAGVFLRSDLGLPTPIGFDIEPDGPHIRKHDFMTVDTGQVLGVDRERLVFVGNPPFGKRGRLARDFLNKTLREGVVTGFVVPLIFRKYITQKTLIESGSLVWDVELPSDAFEFMGQPYDVRCCFQIWTTLPLEGTGLVDLRLRHTPDRAHPDFQMWQYNATPEAEKYFYEPWDFAVLRQGYGDHNLRLFSEQGMSRKKQWIFFKAKDEQVLARLHAIDFNALARTNTSVQGFGKTEVVQQYRAQFEGVGAVPAPQSIALEEETFG